MSGAGDFAIILDAYFANVKKQNENIRARRKLAWRGWRRDLRLLKRHLGLIRAELDKDDCTDEGLIELIRGLEIAETGCSTIPCQVLTFPAKPSID